MTLNFISNIDKSAGIIIFIALIALLISLPFGMIWSINTLFDVNNPYDFTHWVASLLLIILLAGNNNMNNMSAGKAE